MQRDMCSKEDIELRDFGISAYEEILIMQENLFKKVIEEKLQSGKPTKEYLLIGEHFPVITIGRRGKESNILLPEDLLKRKGVDIFRVSRGGDVTYHCEGQLIVYPILDLSLHKLGVKTYIDLLEESVIILLEKYGISGERIEGATGVWLGKGTEKERKICAIGVKCSRFCTMHGLALNVNADISGFSLINPCGFVDKEVTSMQKELGKWVDIEKLKKEFSDIFFSLIFSF